MTARPEALRALEALLFAAGAPLGAAELQALLPEVADLPALLARLQADYADRGVNLVARGDRWLFQTAPDLAHLLRREMEEPRKLSRAAVETLAIVAYHQPVSRADIEAIRGVAVSRGTLDVLVEAGWIRPAGRRESPGRPTVYATTPDFLVHFGLGGLGELPGVEELRAAGLVETETVRFAGNAPVSAALTGADDGPGFFTDEME